MTVSQFYCETCCRYFSVVNAKNVEDAPKEMCPWCSNKNLVLIHREAWQDDRWGNRKPEAERERIP